MVERIWKPRSMERLPAPPDIPRFVWDILVARGIASGESARSHLSPSLKNLRDPQSIRDMDKAVERLEAAFRNKEKVCIYADYDLDGTSGLALLKQGFELLGFEDFLTYQPRRLSEGYGVHVSAIDELSSLGVKVIVTVDVGITALEAASRAKEHGIDLVVTDHHLPGESLPNAYCIVNPNRGDCLSGLGHLSGAGVAFYFVLALRRHFLEKGLLKQDFNPKELLDCFVIGTLTDMVPLKDENRVLVKHGLVQLAQTKRLGLRRLLQELKISVENLNSQDVVLSFAPKLNALSRLDIGLLPKDLFLVDDEEEAERMVREVMKSNEQRKSYQAQAEKRAFEMAKDMAKAGFIWVWSEEFHKGVVGLVATKLSLHYQVPAFVGTITESGEVAGSARVPDAQDINLLDVFESAKDVLARAGGHAKAAGFALIPENVDAFAIRLASWFSGRTTDKLVRNVLFDTEANFDDLSLGNLSWYQHLEPFGSHFPVPVMRFNGVTVASSRELKGGHLKCSLNQGGSRADAIFFSPPKDIRIGPGDMVDILARIHWNHYNGQRTLQLQIEDIKSPL